MPKFNVKLIRYVTRHYTEEDHYLVCVEADSAKDAMDAVRALSAEKVVADDRTDLDSYLVETKNSECASTELYREEVRYALPAGRYTLVDLTWKPPEVTTPAPTL